jgi:UMP-CMP kinase
MQFRRTETKTIRCFDATTQLLITSIQATRIEPYSKHYSYTHNMSDNSSKASASCPYNFLGLQFFGTCLLPIALFAGTVAYITYQQHQLLEKQTESKKNQLPACQVVFVLGSPGSGKGTQCELLKGWVHLSAGDLLRAERRRGGSLGDEINQCIANGRLVPSSVTCQLLERAMQHAYEQTKRTKFVIDGFPRSFENLQAWEESAGKQHQLEFVLNLECPEEVLVGRLVKRGETSGRIDDGPDVIRKRFQTHQKECMPIIEHYEKLGLLKHVASDSSVEDVHKRVALLFEGL